jgi:hypothetical protein
VRCPVDIPGKQHFIMIWALPFFLARVIPSVEGNAISGVGSRLSVALRLNYGVAAENG